MFLLNSRRGRFTAAGVLAPAPLLPKLRGHCAEFLNEVSLARLGMLVPPHLCRFRYGRRFGAPDLFSAVLVPGPPDWAAPLRCARLAAWTAIRQAAPGCILQNLALNPVRRYGNVDPLSIGYAFRPGLRYRLTPGGRTCPGKPWVFGGRDFHPAFRYSCPHNRFPVVHGRYPSRFVPSGNAPLPPAPEGADPRRRHDV